MATEVRLWSRYCSNDDGYVAFFARTRGNYFFAANAKGGEVDLDSFMASFPQ